MEETFSREVLQRIWDHHGLGRVEKIEQPKVGMVNRVFVVNETHVIRFDVLINEGESRYHKEALAYERLGALGVPVPQVIAADSSKILLPHDYLLMTKLEGQPTIHTWVELSPEQQANVAYQAGQHLARIHSVTLEKFGNYAGQERAFDGWYDAMWDYIHRYATEAVAQKLLEPAITAQVEAIFKRHKAVFDAIPQSRLVHRDFQFTNILQKDGQVTGILDFEWSLGGDPSYDFILREQWEEECPGSHEHLYAGYTSLRPLAADHDLRVRLHWLFFVLEWVVDGFDAADSAQAAERLYALLPTFG
ncbi:MAG: phosphotransferase [Anaerolineae bacterium]|nr:phosphotransferase [Anaerolineae bacterium]